MNLRHPIAKLFNEEFDSILWVEAYHESKHNFYKSFYESWWYQYANKVENKYSILFFGQCIL